MKAGFYSRIAVTGMRQNRRLYVPYLLACTGMVMMGYIVYFLSVSSAVRSMSGGATVSAMMSLGYFIMMIFTAIFLFYTNSFLIRRRKKEFGLYNILGMGKRNIGRVLLMETLITAAVSIGAGLILGAVFSKLAELAMVNMIGGDISYSISVSLTAMAITAMSFCIIYALIFINGLRQIHTSNPAELMRSENVGEKPPKANLLLGIGGVILMAGAYYMAVSIKNPLSALTWFFVAVAMVIIATYLIFIAGSVLMCRLLQKNKRYYYKPNHFVSVSSMVYRMKRNGAGLASICILATMVLVMITGSACLYFGAEDSLHARYPKDISAEITLSDFNSVNEEKISLFRNIVDEVIDESHEKVRERVEYCYATVSGINRDGTIVLDADDGDINDMDRIINFVFVSVDDYNRITGNDYHIAGNQVMTYGVRTDYDESRLTFEDGTEFEIVKKLDSFFVSGNTAMDVVPTIAVVVPDLKESLGGLSAHLKDIDQGLRIHWYTGFNTDGDEAEQRQFTEKLEGRLRAEAIDGNDDIYSYSCESLEANRSDFYATYGGLFFLGIILSIIFLCATVLIIYYKQISEGYEDESRFEIMQKVGMTKRNIRRSINSQMLTIFLLPLAMAVIHLAFAFPMIEKLLLLFNLVNLKLLLATAGVSVLIFALFYMVVYKVTSQVYYNIVSGKRAETR